MTYEATLERIHSFEKFGSRLGLERMTKLMELLGNPQEKIKVIHVAGTNGKGSVCRYIYSVLKEQGYKVGLYTSPFLERFTERIELDGNEISKEDLELYTEKVLNAVDIMLKLGMESPTEFEIITAIGFAYFGDKNPDFLVLEVGLGGTGDSTNVISKPVASVITSISYDHMEYLGETLEKIAVEKAGIIKEGVPVIFRVADKSAKAAIKKIAIKNNCRLYDTYEENFTIKNKSVDGYTFDAEVEGEIYKDMFISMVGMHQVSNAICALTVLEVLKKENLISFEKEMVFKGMSKARQTGRFEILKKQPFVIIDGAHNEAGAEALQIALKEHFKGKKILMVVGILADKKVDKLIEKFGMITDQFIATEPDNPRKLSADELCKHIKVAGRNCMVIKSIEEACEYAGKLPSYEVIVFAGSLYLIGKVREILKNEEK